MGDSYTYDIGSSWGQTRILGTAPIVIGARFAASLDYGINPLTGQIDCKFNYVDDYQLAATGLQTDTAMSAFNDVPFGGGVGLDRSSSNGTMVKQCSIKQAVFRQFPRLCCLLHLDGTS